VCAGTADLGRLVRAFHDGSLGLARFATAFDRCVGAAFVPRAVPDSSRLGEKPAILTKSPDRANAHFARAGQAAFQEPATNCG
jgi:hypothetical protein